MIHIRGTCISAVIKVNPLNFRRVSEPNWPIRNEQEHFKITLEAMTSAFDIMIIYQVTKQPIFGRFQTKPDLHDSVISLQLPEFISLSFQTAVNKS